MAKKNLKNALGALLDKAYSEGSLADAAAQMSGLSAPPPSPAAKHHFQYTPPPAIPDKSGKEPSIYNLTGSLTGQLTGEQAGSITGEITDCPDSEPVYHPVQPVNKPASKPVKEPANPQPHKTKEPVSYPLFEPVNEPDNDKWAPFSERQGKILMYLIEAGGIANREQISLVTGVNIATVKYALRMLTKAGFIGNIQLYINHKKRGFTYTMNAQMCQEYAARVNNPDRRPYHDPVRNPVNWPVNKPGTEGGSIPVGVRTAPLVVEKDLNLTTNTPTTALNTLAEILRDDPELEWWHARDLQSKQVETWMETAGCSEGSMLQSLRHFAFDMQENGREAEMKKDPSNYFFSVLRKAGSYKAPTGYRSRAQRLADSEEELLREQLAEIKRLADIRHQREEACLELEFQKILSDPENAAYQDLISGLNDFEKKSSGRIREVGLRRLFNEMKGIADE